MKKILRGIVRILKKRLYFAVAAYFVFFARIYLRRWRPMIITVTGSSGKTTMLHMFEAQLGDKACYSHRANSTFGIPFHILGLERKHFRAYEWLIFAAHAPFAAFRPARPERIYVTEADAERPGEGTLLARLLKPHIIVWLSLEEAHGIQYDERALTTDLPLHAVKTAMAEEFGEFVRQAQTLAILNMGNEYIAHEALLAHAPVIKLFPEDIAMESVERDVASFTTPLGILSSPHLVPPDAGLSLYAVARVIQRLDLPLDSEFKKFVLPPGRSSVLRGVRETTLVDSSYNATMDGMRTMLSLFARYPATGEKWLVLGDMIEQGKSEAYEHTQLAANIIAVHPNRIVLVGPRLAKYTKLVLERELSKTPIVAYDLPDEARVYLAEQLKGGETILFKGARYLEGIVERLLADPTDAEKLCRRGAFWDAKRKTWGI